MAANLISDRDQLSRAIRDLAIGAEVSHHPDAEPLIAHHGLVGLAMGTPLQTEELNAAWMRFVTRQGVMERHLSRVLQSLAGGEVKACVVKGPHLDHQIYPRAGLRTFTDVDVVVPADQAERAIDIIRGDPSCVAVPGKGPKADKRELVFRDSSGLTFALDLHWDLFGYHQLRGAAAGAMDHAWNRAASVEAPYGPEQRLPDEIVFAFLCTHAVLDHRFRLILFRDLWEYAARGFDWDALVDACRRFNLASFVHLAGVIGRQIGIPAIPDSVLDRLQVDSAVSRMTERLLERTDLVTFDGHSMRLLNLAIVLLHDRRPDRIALAIRAPRALPGWRKRIQSQET